MTRGAVRGVPVGRDPFERERYFVEGVTGYTIEPRAPSRANSGPPSTSYSVVDRCTGREVAGFNVTRRLKSPGCQARAHALAAELNADERAWEREVGVR